MATSGIGKRRLAARGEGTEAYHQKRREIIETAAQVFKTRGFRGTGIGEIAKVLGTDRASLYYYIGSKEELFDEVVTEAVEANLVRAEAIRDSDAPASDKVRELVESLMASYDVHYPFLYVFIQENLSHVAAKRSKWAARMRRINKRYEAATIDIIQQGYDAGTLREIGPAWVVAYGMIGLVAWTNRWFDPSQSQADAATIGRVYADLLLGGLASATEPERTRRPTSAVVSADPGDVVAADLTVVAKPASLRRDSGGPLRAAVIGGGTMGVGIAHALATSGVATTVVEPDDVRAATLDQELSAALAAGVERGKLTPADASAAADRVRRVRDVTDLAHGLDLIVETVPERAELKRRVLAPAEAHAPRLLATNTSSLSIDGLAEGLAQPDRFLGMHFFNPVWALGLVELVRGAATSEVTMDVAREWVALLGKQAAVVRDSPGFATSRLDLCLALEAIRMLEEDVATADDIDRALRLAYRHPVGPLRLSDIVGLDVRLDIARSLETSLGPRFAPPQLLQDRVAAGELGRKSGRGLFDWT